MCAYVCAAVHAYVGVCQDQRRISDALCVILHLIPLIEGQSMSLEIDRQPGNTINPTVCLITQLALDYTLTYPHRHFFNFLYGC